MRIGTQEEYFSLSLLIMTNRMHVGQKFEVENAR